MAIIKPFPCIRPNEKIAERVAALPYDVYNREEAKREVEREPFSFLKIDRAETQFPDEVDTYDPCVYKKAKELLDAAMEDGTFLQEKETNYYIYEMDKGNHSQIGIVACASIDDYQNNIIQKHENTREEKEQDRIMHVDVCQAQTGPIFLTYRSNEIINQIVKQVRQNTPIYNFTTLDGVTHKIWNVANKSQITTIEETFQAIDHIYIADGHHRAASAVKVGLKRRKENPNYTGEEEFNYFLSVLVPDDQLLIMDYNRVVKDLNGYSKEEFLNQIEKNFAVKEIGKAAYHPEKKAEFGMYLEGNWYQLVAKDHITKITDVVESLDVSILQQYLLEPILQIGDLRTEKRIDFIGGIRGLEELERRVNKDMKVAFSMYPTSIQELFAVADAKRLMPPKSTWFEPKLRSGLFIHKI